jgi:hypothetical protein
MGRAVRGLFRPLEEYAAPSILTVGALCFVFSLDIMLGFSSESACLLFVARDTSTMIWILEFQHLD